MKRPKEKLKTVKPHLNFEDLPPKLRRQIKTFLERAPHGISAYPELQTLAFQAGYYDAEPLSANTVKYYRHQFLTALAHMDLREDMCIENLLILEARSVERCRQEFLTLRNPHIDKYCEAERAVDSPGYKRAGYDSDAFARFISAICAIARFNGEFSLPLQFRRHYRIALDKRTRHERKILKQRQVSRQWVDAEILRLKKEFDVIIRNKSFLTDRRDLRLCLFLPKLVVLRYLGLRQNNLIGCRVGTNIIFGPEDSIRFRFASETIRRTDAINITISKDLHGGVEELVLTLNVLKNYKLGILDVIRSQDPKLYQNVMDDNFFAKAASNRRVEMIEPYIVEGEPSGVEERACRTLHDSFLRDALEFMNMEQNGGDPSAITINCLRQICFDWMHTDLGMP